MKVLLSVLAVLIVSRVRESDLLYEQNICILCRHVSDPETLQVFFKGPDGNTSLM